MKSKICTETDTQRDGDVKRHRRMPSEDRGGDWNCGPQARKYLSLPETERDKKGSVPYKLQGEHSPANTSILHF